MEVVGPEAVHDCIGLGFDAECPRLTQPQGSELAQDRTCAASSNAAQTAMVTVMVTVTMIATATVTVTVTVTVTRWADLTAGVCEGVGSSSSLGDLNPPVSMPQA